MNNTITTKSISELLELNFYVPAYQRGYRWTQLQVDDLLNDIYAFATKKNKSDKEFYCLQPIILKEKVNEENIIYEVIDGQQRLTTLRILFSYLIDEKLSGKPLKKRYGKNLYNITYETRPNCTSFLDNIKDSKENIDFYHISKAYRYIEQWVEKKVEEGLMFDDVLDSIFRTLVYNQSNKKEEGILKVIWYEIKDVKANPIDIFIRINLGKISLTNSELIKALFLQKRNFGKGDAAKLKQLEIAHEWDKIENELQEENFWWFLNKEENKASSHIEFIFDMMKTSIINKQEEEEEEDSECDDYQTFRFFNDQIGDTPSFEVIKTLWDEVKKYYYTFKEWYNNPVWYHYIGFLIYCGVTIETIFEVLNPLKIKTKEEATKELIKLVSKQFSNISWVKEKKTEEEKTSEVHFNINYKSDKFLLRNFYLMFNIQHIVEKNLQNNIIYKFPFKSFKIGNKNTTWDIEHINSATENPLVKLEEKKEWLENASLDLVDLIDEDFKLEINNFLEQENDNANNFEDLHDRVINISGDQEIDIVLKNSIGNLTLLDAGTNRGYGNALFSTKRRKIIEKDKAGTFIPVCTKNVFLKYFDGNLQNKWTEKDIYQYRKSLEKTMSKFIKPMNS